MQGVSGRRLVAIGAVCWTVATAAQSQSFDAVRLEGDGAQSGGRVGLAAIAGYKYMGSDERRYLALPTIDYRWSNGWFAGMGNGIGYRVASSPEFQYGVRLTGDFGRKEHRSAVLRGLGDVDARPELGTFFNWQFARDFSLTSSLRYGSGNERDGLVVDVGAQHGIQLAPQWRLGMSVSATWANRSYTQSYFGITPEQSARSGYAVSEVDAGLRDVRAGVSLVYFINRDWAATLAMSAGSLQGDAKDSVIVRERSPVSGVLAVGYRF
jgi:MipA family protein